MRKFCYEERRGLNYFIFVCSFHASFHCYNLKFAIDSCLGGDICIFYCFLNLYSIFYTTNNALAVDKDVEIMYYIFHNSEKKSTK